MSRCLLCRARLWPWQSAGHLILTSGTRLRWHGRCWREAEAARDEREVLDQLNALGIGFGEVGQNREVWTASLTAPMEGRTPVHATHPTRRRA